MSTIASPLATKASTPCDEHEPTPSSTPRQPAPRVRRLGRIRLPIAGPYRPWATAYRFPDGRLLWCVRLWEIDRPVRHCVSSETVRWFCQVNWLPRVEREVDRIEGR